MFGITPPRPTALIWVLDPRPGQYLGWHKGLSDVLHHAHLLTHRPLEHALRLQPHVAFVLLNAFIFVLNLSQERA
jgi:hypothetical protein